MLLGTAFLAYSFGLRHAVDADHIAAIDNVTRKLMQRGERPVAAGFYFSLGHATVVVLASLALALATGALERRFADFHRWGGLIGTCVSALFLFAVAAANLGVLGAVWRRFRAARRGSQLAEDDIDRVLGRRRLSRRASSGRCSAWCARAGTCIRWASCSGWASTPRPRSRFSASPRPKPPRACRSARS